MSHLIFLKYLTITFISNYFSQINFLQKVSEPQDTLTLVPTKNICMGNVIFIIEGE